ncbi:MAG: glycoside hydrolase family 20 zincin-like fold domain-containing protein [Chitinophagaceae bacterium]
MKKTLCLILVCFGSAIAFAQNLNTDIAIIPEPVSITKNTGRFSLQQNTVILAPDIPEMKEVTRFLKDRLSTPTGMKVSVQNTATSAAIQLVLNKTMNAALGNEGYNLSVTPTNVIIKANKPAGLFYGMQTLVAIIPKRN